MNKPVTQESYREWHTMPGKGKKYEELLFAKGQYDAAVWEIERRMLRRLIKSLYEGSIGRYLDFACGTGRIFSTVKDLATYRVGVDISEEMLSLARSKWPDERFVNVDITTDMCARESLGQFDLVTAFRFFLNAEPELRADAVRALRSMIRPGGYLICNNHGNSTSMLALVLIARYLMKLPVQNSLSCKDLCKLLETHGFKVVAVKGVVWWPRILYRVLTVKIWQLLEALTRGVPGIDRLAIYQIVVAQRI